MNKNVWWWIIGIVVVVLVVLLFSGAFTGAAIFQRTVNAHACSADGVCETARLDVSRGDINLHDSGSGASNAHILLNDFGNLIVDNIRDIDLKSTIGMITLDGESISIKANMTKFYSYVVIGEGLQTAGNVFLYDAWGDSVAFNGNWGDPNGNPSPMLITKFTGNGTGYLCIADDGVVFRSQAPCV